jgi:cytochrome c
MSRGIVLSVVLLLSLAQSARAADAERGAQRFRVLCGTCHAVDPGQRKMSSHMRGLIGRKAGSVDGVAFSTALKTSGWVWTKALLDKYLADPKKALPGTTMMVAAGDADRADIIAYIATLK